MRTDPVRPGATLVEALAVLTLTSLLIALVVGVCVAQLRLARVTAERAVSTDAARTARVVLSGEARRMTHADVRARSDDSIAVRAFRGAGLPCGTTPGSVLVRYSGDRLPDPDKDSVLVVAATGMSVLALLESDPAASSCTAIVAEEVLEWRLAGMIPPAAVLLVFESGSYHLSGGALRYRIGAAGRQPLTAEALLHPQSRFTAVDDRAIRFDIAAHDLPQAGHSAYFAQPWPPP